MLDLITIALASWYLAYVLVNLDGMFSVFQRVRSWRYTHNLTSCIYCTMPYMALACWLIWRVAPEVIQVVGIAGLALMAHRYTGGNHI